MNKDNAREATMSEILRMCYVLNCGECPISAINDTDEDCAKYCLSHPEAANKAVIEWCEAHPDMRWISIEERRPRFCESVIAASSNGNVWRDEYMSDGFIFEKIYGRVTHWMPMPKAPGGGSVGTIRI